jgi:hypothetical protein
MSSSWCNNCGQILTPETAYVYEMLSGKKQIKKAYMENKCKPCNIRENRIRNALEKKHPRPPSGAPCECCGRIDKLHLDHCHSTDKFLGYCCKNCNVGIGHLGNSPEGVARALDYLQRAHGRRDDDEIGGAMEDEGLSIANSSVPHGTPERIAGDNEAGENILGRETEYNIA